MDLLTPLKPGSSTALSFSRSHKAHPFTPEPCSSLAPPTPQHRPSLTPPSPQPLSCLATTSLHPLSGVNFIFLFNTPYRWYIWLLESKLPFLFIWFIFQMIEKNNLFGFIVLNRSMFFQRRWCHPHPLYSPPPPPPSSWLDRGCSIVIQFLLVITVSS